MSSLDNYFNTNTGLGINQAELSTVQNNINLLDANALYIDGTKSMTGDLNLGTTNDIINVDNTTTNKIYLISPTDDFQGCLFIKNSGVYVDLAQSFTNTISGIISRMDTAETDINTLESTVFYKDGSQSASASSTWNMNNSTITGGNICNFLTYQINSVAITANADELNMSDISGAKGTAEADKVLTVDASRDVVNINSLTTYNINATTLNGSAIGSLSKLIYLTVENPPYTNSQVTAYYNTGGTLAGKAIITHPTGNHVFGLGQVGCTKCVTNEIENPASVNADLKLSATKFNLIIQNYGTTGTIDVKYLATKYFRIMTTAGTEKLRVNDTKIASTIPMSMGTNYIDGVTTIEANQLSNNASNPLLISATFGDLIIQNIGATGTIINKYELTKSFTISSGGVDRFLINDSGSTLIAPLNMSSQKITNLSNGTVSADAVNLGQMNTALGLYLPLSGGTMTGSITLNGYQLNGAGDIFNKSGQRLALFSTDNDIILQASSGKKTYIQEYGGAQIAELSITEMRLYRVLNMGSNKINNLANGTVSGDAVNYGQLQLYLPLSGSTMTGNINMDSNRIQGILRLSANDSNNTIEIYDGSGGFSQKIFSFTSSGITAGIAGLTMGGLRYYLMDGINALEFKNSTGSTTYFSVNTTCNFYTPLDLNNYDITRINKLSSSSTLVNEFAIGNAWTVQNSLGATKLAVGDSASSLFTSLDMGGNTINGVGILQNSGVVDIRVFAQQGNFLLQVKPTGNINFSFWGGGNMAIFDSTACSFYRTIGSYDIRPQSNITYSLGLTGQRYLEGWIDTIRCKEIKNTDAGVDLAIKCTTGRTIFLSDATNTFMSLANIGITMERDLLMTNKNISSFSEASGGNISLNTATTFSTTLTVNHNNKGGVCCHMTGYGWGVGYGLRMRQGVDTSGSHHITFQNVAGSELGSIYYNGTGITYATTSDYRLKEDVKPLDDYKNRLMKLKPVKYIMKDNKQKTRGFLAHQVQEAGYCECECVLGEKDAVDKDGKPINQMVDITRFIPDMVAMIQHQQETIKTLNERITALEAKHPLSGSSETVSKIP